LTVALYEIAHTGTTGSVHAKWWHTWTCTHVRGHALIAADGHRRPMVSLDVIDRGGCTQHASHAPSRSLVYVRGVYHSQGCAAQAPKSGAEAMHIQVGHVASSLGESGCQCCCGDILMRAGEHGGEAACSTRDDVFCCCVGGRGWSGPDPGSTGATGAHA